MRAIRIFIAVALIVLPSLAAAFPCSVCRCGDQSFFLNNARRLGAGRFLFALEHFNTRKSAAAENQAGGLTKIFWPLGADGDLESQVQNAVQLTFNYGLSSRIMLMASIPYTFNSISSASGVETAKGFGDPEIIGIAHLLSFVNDAWTLRGSAGARLPFGKSDQTDEAGVRLDQHLQTGSGAWAGAFGVQVLHPSRSVPLFFSTNYQANGTNAQDFAYGNVLRFNVAGQKALSKLLDVIAEINGRVADYDTAGGEHDPNSGGTIIYFSPGLRLQLGNALSLRSQVQIPVVEDLHGVQDEKVNVRTGLVWSL